MSAYDNKNLAKPAFCSVDIEELHPCNAIDLIKWLGGREAVEITPVVVRRAADLGLLSCNWFADRFLTRRAMETWRCRAVRRLEQEGVAVNWWWPLLAELHEDERLRVTELTTNATSPPQEIYNRGCTRLQHEIMVRELMSIIKEGDARYEAQHHTNTPAQDIG